MSFVYSLEDEDDVNNNRGKGEYHLSNSLHLESIHF